LKKEEKSIKKNKIKNWLIWKKKKRQKSTKKNQKMIEFLTKEKNKNEKNE